MFEAKDEIKEKVDALMSLASQYERGQCISWGEIEAIVGPREQYMYIIKRWRNQLERDREIVTLPAISVGVRLLTHKETAAEIPAIRQRRAYRQIRRAIKQTATVDMSRLSDHERKLLASQRANMSETRRELFRSRKQLASGRVTETAPRRRASA